jgi:hypothetical protein
MNPWEVARGSAGVSLARYIKTLASENYIDSTAYSLEGFTFALTVPIRKLVPLLDRQGRSG